MKGISLGAKRCETCEGQKHIYPSTKEDAKWVITNYHKRKHHKRVYRDYLATGRFTCPDCDGSGKVEVWS